MEPNETDEGITILSGNPRPQVKPCSNPLSPSNCFSGVAVLQEEDKVISGHGHIWSINIPDAFIVHDTISKML